MDKYINSDNPLVKNDHQPKDHTTKSKNKKVKNKKVKNKKIKKVKNKKKSKEALSDINTSQMIDCNRYLSQKGYVIKKKSISDEDLRELKKNLTVKPNIPRQFATFIKPFRVYLENKNKIYIPKQYGLDKYGIPTTSNLSKGEKIKLKFKGELRDKQKPVIESFLKSCNLDKKSKKSTKAKKSTIKNGGGIIAIPCGYGKCLGKDTPVLMYNGTIKKVQNIVVGDKLMGDDSMARNVLSICKGVEDLFKIHQQNGDSYVVNKSHILSLLCKSNATDTFLPSYKKVDLDVMNYLSIKKNRRDCYGYSTTLNFPVYKVSKDPYKFGEEIGNWLETILEFSRKVEDRHHSSKNHNIDNTVMLSKYSIKDLLPFLVNSYRVREQFLAGLIDTSGYDRKYSCFIWFTLDYNISKHNKQTFLDLINTIKLIAKSIGIGVKVLPITKILYKIVLYGKKLVMLPYKNTKNYMSFNSPYKNINYRDKYILSKLSVESLGSGDYYGFEIDGNRRFLLGDCTVTHNTVCALKIVTKIKRKTLIIVHKEFLMDQWKERISQFVPTARIGTLQQKVVDIKNKDIVLAMLQSLSMKEYPKKQEFEPNLCMARQKTNPNKQCSYQKMDLSDYCKRHNNYSEQRIDESVSFDSFGLCIVDECHHIAAEVFSKALKKVSCPYMLGLSATPDRNDGLSKVFKWYMGPIVYQIKQRHKEEVYVKCIEILSDYEPYCRTVLNYMQKPVIPTMVTNICSYDKRTLLVALLIQKCYKNKRRILVLSDRRGHLEAIKDSLEKLDIHSVGFYMGGMKKEVLKESLSCKILLGTYTMVSEGFDHPELDTIIMATSRSNIEQSIGRILRKKHERVKPLVVDIVDTFSSFMNQAYKRRRFYRKNLYPYSIFQLSDEGPQQEQDWINQIKKIDLEPTKEDIKEGICLQNKKEDSIKKNSKINKKNKKGICLIDDY